MAKDNPQVDDLLAQLAAETARADNAERKLTETKSQYETTEGNRLELSARLAQLEQERADNALENVPRLKAQLDALIAENRRLERERKDALSEESIRGRVAQRVELETHARAVLGDAVLTDLSDREVRVKTIEKARGIRIDAEESDERVRGRFDAIVEAYACGQQALGRVHAARAVAEKNEGRADKKDPFAAYAERMRKLGQEKLPR